MWNHLSFDLLAKIFTFLPPDSLACAASACKDWHRCTKSYSSSSHLIETRFNPPWFLGMITPKNYGHCCYAYNSVCNRWYLLPLDFLLHPIHPIAPIGSLILYRPANSPVLQLAICNPFTKQCKSLPPLNTLRTTPAVGVIEASSSNFRIFVAGGMSASSKGSSGSGGGGGASYEPTLEMYDSNVEKWQTIGLMPNIFAVRLTVWTPNDSVYLMGILYWITSARAYSIMGFNINSGLWKEVNVPMADRLEFAALVRRKEQLTLIGGKSREEACIWELGLGDVWNLIERVPVELGKKFTGSRGSWYSTKCVWTDKAVYLYKDLGSKMLVWMGVEGNASKWEWFWVEGCYSIKGQQVPNFPIKGVLLHPNLAPSSILTSV
ncbi:hypothetical protein AQUCO_00100809v1 [Aquilegia coerulea]|uniref:Uncharacterized protein n=1 Tax=Aquilegia coerulea TaxID=218851 RepID=A0A2G5FC78_AQUCA|nr:hypothetical protein AQUCO_00100809v1 [Aquilegia coerulea]